MYEMYVLAHWTNTVYFLRSIFNNSLVDKETPWASQKTVSGTACSIPNIFAKEDPFIDLLHTSKKSIFTLEIAICYQILKDPQYDSRLIFCVAHKYV